MTENDNFFDDSEEEDFEKLLNQYESGMTDDLNVGDKISGEIIAVDSQSVFIDTGTKTDGSVQKEELIDENGEFPYNVGDVLDLYVVSMNESEIILSRAMSGTGGKEVLKEAFENGVPVGGKVAAVIKGGFQIEAMKQRAFCPVSQMDVKYVETPEDFVGKTYEFLITRFEESGRNIVVSRRELLNREIEKSRAEFLEHLTPEQELSGRVTKLMPYGAFIELSPGVEGMAHVSELSWSHINKPEEAVSPGDLVTVRVIKIEDAENGKPPKISLSVKQAAGDPWDTVSDKIKAGEIVNAVVTRCAGFGAFAQILPGIEGLIHISEMSYTKRILKPEDAVSPGNTYPVLIREIDTEKRRISLSLREAEGDPWADIENQFKAGEKVKGIVEKKETFGYFISLSPGITGLLHKSKFSESAKASHFDNLKPGAEVSVVIDEIDKSARKISLGTESGSDDSDWKSYREKTPAASGGGLGSLGEKLQAAMKSKNKK